MSDTLGTDAGNLTGQGGAVTNTAGDSLLGTDNDGGTSYALGPSLSRAITTGVINGDVAAGSLSVAAGARMRGRAEFGWNETGNPRPVERK